jgi:hypothetical protein
MVMDHWQKTAMVIVKTDEALRKAGEQVYWEDIAERIEALDARGDMESQGGSGSLAQQRDMPSAAKIGRSLSDGSA